VSDSAFTIASRIQITRPGPGRTWTAATREDIRWTHDYGPTQTFDVDVSTDGGSTWTSLVQSVPATSATDGTARVDLPGVVTAQAVLRVSPAGRPGDGATVPFSLAAPSLTFSFPTAGTTWVIGSTHSISWGGNVGTVNAYTFSLSEDGGATWHTITGTPHLGNPVSSTLIWTVQGPVTTHARIRVQWSRAGLTATTESADFTIASRITVTAPNTAVSWFVDSVHAITWTHNYGPQQTFEIDFSADGGATWSGVAASVPAATAAKGSFSWTVPNVPTTGGLIRVSPTNAIGNGDSSDVTFTIGTLNKTEQFAPEYRASAGSVPGTWLTVYSE